MGATVKNGHNWVIPESPEKLAVEEEQIVKRNLSVMYHGISCRIELSKATVKEISSKVEIYNDKYRMIHER